MILPILPLAWKNLWRNRRRSILTILGVAAAIFVFATLGAVIEGITFPVREVGADRLLKTREAGRSNVLASQIPANYDRQIEAVEGVKQATSVLSDLAIIEPDMVHVFVRGVEPQRYRQVRGLKVDSAAWRTFESDRRAAVVGHRLMERMGWAVGADVEIEQIGLRSVIVGSIPAQGVDLENHMLVHLETLQVLRGAEGQATYVLVAPVENSDPGQVAQTIDRTMALAPIPTRTASSAAYAEAVVDDFMGFVRYLNWMAAITMLITVLGAGNAIAMSVRERTREIGVLKAIGFRPATILAGILIESIGLAALGGILGIATAALALGSQAANLAGLMLSQSTIQLAAVLAILTGLLGGLLPAASAARLKPVDALRGIG